MPWNIYHAPYIYIYDPTPIVKDSIFLLDENTISFINKAAVWMKMFKLTF